MLILLLPSASASSLPREQCWPQGSAPTNAAQNAAAISVLRSWGSAFDALAGSDVCHMATRSAARKGAPSGSAEACWPVQCERIGQELVVTAFSMTTDSVRPGVPLEAANADASSAVQRWLAALPVAPAAAGAIPASLSQSNFPQLTHVMADGHELSGTLPSTLLGNKKLRHLNLDYNALSGSIGSFASEELEVLKLSSNKFSGSLPADVVATHRPGMRPMVFTAQRNQLSGAIPSFPCLGAACDQERFSVLRLNDNRLSGAVPASAVSHRQG